MKEKQSGRGFLYCEVIIGVAFLAFGILGLFFGEGHDPLIMGAFLVQALGFFLKAAERKKSEEGKDELLQEDEEESK
ncbi:MAG: hypothetical protein J6038_00270 [Bacilli bacterium]|nr:hypothetical protein [Bacilli bacterium]